MLAFIGQIRELQVSGEEKESRCQPPSPSSQHRSVSVRIKMREEKKRMSSQVAATVNCRWIVRDSASSITGKTTAQSLFHSLLSLVIQGQQTVVTDQGDISKVMRLGSPAEQGPEC